MTAAQQVLAGYVFGAAALVAIYAIQNDVRRHWPSIVRLLAQWRNL